jgi:hypothetical protein
MKKILYVFNVEELNPRHRKAAFNENRTFFNHTIIYIINRIYRTTDTTPIKVDPNNAFISKHHWILYYEKS